MILLEYFQNLQQNNTNVEQLVEMIIEVVSKMYDYIYQHLDGKMRLLLPQPLYLFLVKMKECHQKKERKNLV